MSGLNPSATLPAPSTQDMGVGVGASLSPCPHAPTLQSVQQNGSIYIHVYFTKSGFHPDPRQKALYRRLATVHMSRSKFLPALRSGWCGRTRTPRTLLVSGHPWTGRRRICLEQVEKGPLEGEELVPQKGRAGRLCTVQTSGPGRPEGPE